MINRITPELITELNQNSIFVFGSNLAGRHGAGAALIAKNQFGAIYGVGFGPQGQCYAIPTKDRNLKVLPLDEIEPYVKVFIEYAKLFPKLTFKVTKIGCGLSGYSVSDIAPMFRDAIKLNNIHLPIEFWDELNKY